jgi:predicted metal-dependent enzyme (double-stranded beta helix superfamily)
MPTNHVSELFHDVAATNWHDLAAVHASSDKLLTELADPRLLRELTERAINTPDLLALCEHYDILDKLVLHNDPSGWRLRLHVFLPGYFDRPHNHRWTYSSRILHGHYTHTLYGSDDQLDDTADTTPDVARLEPRMVRTETTGDFYTLHHTMIHSVTATPYTTSLIVRGPAVKGRFLVTDRVTNQSWWQYGAATESPEEAAKKRMNPNDARQCVQHLIDHGIL